MKPEEMEHCGTRMDPGDFLSALGLEASDFDEACALYREWNSKINVISRKDIDKVFEHHVLHSLCIAAFLKSEMTGEYLRWKTGAAPDASPSVSPSGSGEYPVRVLDLGCGGGFPGIPLAICFPSVRFTLCDSVGKKITVASAVAQALGLKNVECVNSRAENLSGRWDWVVSRAVAPLDKLLEWSGGKYSKGLICLKGGDVQAEIDACRRIRERHIFRLWSIGEGLSDGYFEGKSVVCASVAKFL